MIQGYYYLHTNGDLIYKRDLGDTIADLRDSNFVRAIWPVDQTDRENAWRIVVEASSLGARQSRILELVEKWKCTDEDGLIYAERIGAVVQMDGNKWFATRKDFVDLAVSLAGFGETVYEALAELCKELGFHPDKLGWGTTFEDLLKT